MPTIIKIKNKTNWAVTIISGLGLLLLAFIILILNPFVSIQEEGLFFATPFIAFFILFLYIWLWNTFGKTILTIDPEKVTVRYKNKLFTKPKTYLKKETDQILVKDFQVEKYKFGVRYHFSLSGSTYSVVLIQKDIETRMVDWNTEAKAIAIANEIKNVWHY